MMQLLIQGGLDSYDRGDHIKIKRGGDTDLVIKLENRKEKITSVCNKWASLVQFFKPNSDKYADVLNENMIEILNLNSNTAQLTPDEWNIVITKLLEADAPTFFKSVDHIIGINQPPVAIIREIFFNIVLLIESKMLKYLALYNSESDIAKCMNEWKSLNAEYKIKTSSVLLMFICPPNQPSDLPWMPPDSKGWESKIPRLKLPKDFEADLKNFGYLGFCPKEPVKRLKLLLRFPIHRLPIDFSLVQKSIDAKKQRPKNIYSNWEETVAKTKIKTKDDIQKNMSILCKLLVSHLDDFKARESNVAATVKYYNKINDEIAKLIT
jgi:hypothetical protein